MDDPGGADEGQVLKDYVCASCCISIRVILDSKESVPDGDLGNRNLNVDEVLKRMSLLNSNAKVPICQECMTQSLDKLKQEIAQANNDLSRYTEALFELEREQRSGSISINTQRDSSDLFLREDALTRELTMMKEREAFLLQELETLEVDERNYDEQLSKLAKDSVSLNRLIIDSEESIDSVMRRIQYCSTSLKKLKRFNLLSEAFFIHTVSEKSSLDSIKFGSINGLRLGRSKDDPVPWTEINAAWGFLCLLADVVVKKCGIALSQYRLLPRGSYSVIIKKSDRSALELYADETNGGITRFLTGRKFDTAMTAFTEIVSEVIAHLSREDVNFRVDFPITDSGKIDSVPVSLQFNSDENWSRAMKMLLANMKRIVVFVESTRGPR